MRKLLLILLFYSCENTITNDSDSTTYEVVINEINYNSLDDEMEDWIELYNPTNEAITIDMWEFKDNNDNVFTFPQSVVLPSGDYLVLCENMVAFLQTFPNTSNVVGDFEFGLSGDGDLVSLFDSNGLLVDKVAYGVTTPWPTEADGEGATLELIHPSLDNASAGNWAPSNINGGTPGEINSVFNE